MIKFVIFSTSQNKYKGFKGVFVKNSDENKENNKDDEIKVDFSDFKENDSFVIEGYKTIEIKK